MERNLIVTQSIFDEMRKMVQSIIDENGIATSKDIYTILKRLALPKSGDVYNSAGRFADNCSPIDEKLSILKDLGILSFKASAPSADYPSGIVRNILSNACRQKIDTMCHGLVRGTETVEEFIKHNDVYRDHEKRYC